MKVRRDKKIYIIGGGQGGGKAACCLAALGYRHLTVVDFDVVEKSDIGKAPDVFKKKHLKMKKALAVKESLEDSFSDINVDAISTSFSDFLAQVSTHNACAVLDMTDTMVSKAKVVEFCIEENIPYAGGGMVAYKIDIVVSPSLQDSACLFCIEDYEQSYYDEKEKASEPSCQKRDRAGFIPTSNLSASIGVALLCIEVDKLLTVGQKQTTHTSLLVYPTPKHVKTVTVKKNPSCIICGRT